MTPGNTMAEATPIESAIAAEGRREDRARLARAASGTSDVAKQARAEKRRRTTAELEAFVAQGRGN
jgi:hypothetical protein